MEEGFNATIHTLFVLYIHILDLFAYLVSDLNGVFVLFVVGQTLGYIGEYGNLELSDHPLAQLIEKV